MNFHIPPKPRLSFRPPLNFNFPKLDNLRLSATKAPLHSLSLCESSDPNPQSQSGFAMKGGKSKAETRTADNKDRLSVKKGAGAAKAGRKSSKKEKDPNMPKRPASAFFVFLEEFRQQYKEKHPNNKSVSVVGKASGDKWKSMSEAEKAPYVAKAEKRKKDYEKNMEAYNKKLAQGTNATVENGSEKSRSEANDEDEEEEEDSGEEEDDE